MTAALVAVSPRVAALIKMLGSDKDHEVIASVRALQRTLAAAGADLHDLADVVERSVERSARPPGQEPAHHHECGDHRAMAAWILNSGAYLFPKEESFVAAMAHRFGSLSSR